MNVRLKFISWYPRILQEECFPETLPFRPIVGDYIASGKQYGKRKLEFKIVSCTIKTETDVYLEVELGLTDQLIRESDGDFEWWYEQFLRDNP
jgi:hypothetical protein